MLVLTDGFAELKHKFHLTVNVEYLFYFIKSAYIALREGNHA